MTFLPDPCLRVGGFLIYEYMRKKIDKIFTNPTQQNKVYRCKMGHSRKKKTSWWQQIYSLFF